jgi:hypothetical protein
VGNLGSSRICCLLPQLATVYFLFLFTRCQDEVTICADMKYEIIDVRRVSVTLCGVLQIREL